MDDLIAATDQYNLELSQHCASLVNMRFGIDYAQGNRSAVTQLAITQGFRRAILAAGTIQRVDSYLDKETRALLADFSMSDRVHK